MDEGAERDPGAKKKEDWGLRERKPISLSTANGELRERKSMRPALNSTKGG